jgi:DNA-binding response OmpR family regulator
VTRGSQVIDLTPTEFAILTVLMRHAGRVVTRTRLAESVWQGDTSFNVIDVHIGNLRKKLDGAGAVSAPIRTVRGAGYRIRPQGGGASMPASRRRSSSSSSRQVGFDTAEG